MKNCEMVEFRVVSLLSQAVPEMELRILQVVSTGILFASFKWMKATVWIPKITRSSYCGDSQDYPFLLMLKKIISNSQRLYCAATEGS